MRKYLLDAGPLGAYLLGYSKATTLISPWIANREVVTSDIAYTEVYEGIQSLRDASSQSINLLNLILTTIPSLSLTFPIYHRYASIRRYLRPRNELIGDMDTLIAATALEESLSIVTNNPKHFNRIPGLSVITYPVGI
jgi:tRNA(fMet)-specific endonuclease VapC